ncbi:hypothetical protein [uncultured Shewanella sp.]|uniref:hypothetical protein n=1 Tax=uncultured Shewanella sp. TaxID=173975 RepID=UPI002627C9E8|nr:hypothetical protein [uncultured Shewanella sp.]
MAVDTERARIVAALALRGMKVLSSHSDRVICIEHPSQDFIDKAVEITERDSHGLRTRLATQFNGITVCWSKY